MNIGEGLIYYLPSFSDNDQADEHVGTLTLASGASLPDFLTFSEDGWFLTIQPIEVS